jgi:hypothetical protein
MTTRFFIGSLWPLALAYTRQGSAVVMEIRQMLRRRLSIVHTRITVGQGVVGGNHAPVFPRSPASVLPQANY